MDKPNCNQFHAICGIKDVRCKFGIISSIAIKNTGTVKAVEIIIFFDNDKAGLEACIKVKEYLTKILGSEILSFIVPIPYLKDNVKDPSDLRKFNNLQFNTIINKLKLKL